MGSSAVKLMMWSRSLSRTSIRSLRTWNRELERIWISRMKWTRRLRMLECDSRNIVASSLLKIVIGILMKICLQSIVNFGASNSFSRRIRTRSNRHVKRDCRCMEPT